ncbi:hypothetical protein UNSWDHB_2829 [Dehalobacter sp. UNSWDHB]|uniref:hypothetical protein n=1 Tax=unclassified Dehalobacter TaxID=2635733 RepID=UPI00038775F6|nr:MULTISPECIES: hypothetical protein [unclassified Dehalobacter]EQB19893.1 hypothetical protein UNSWDHB_2829 [Dehalobacter sp. UNSWDHB]OCZ49940.1 hypothetical protein A7D23_00920 [Dehalobacter sp. TeCB1]
MLYVSICIFLLMFVLNFLFKIASFFRLGIPLLYAFVVPLFFADWLHNNEALAMGIWYVLIGLVLLSWIVSIRKKIRRRRELKESRYNEDINT